MMHNAQSSAWRRWQEFCERRFLARSVILKAQMKQSRAEREGRLRRGWTVWTKLVVTKNALALGAAHQSFVIRYENRLKRKSLLRLCRSKLALAFTHWVDKINRHKYYETLMQKTRNQWKNRLQVRAFRSWFIHSIMLKENRKKLRRALRRMKHRSLHVAWTTLLEFSYKKRKMIAIYAKLFGCFRRRKVDAAFSAWYRNIRRERQQELMKKTKEKEFLHIRSTLLRLLNAKLSAAFASWKLYNRYTLVIEYKKNRAVRRWTQIRLSKAFFRFCTNAKKQRNQRIKLSRALHNMSLGHQKRSLLCTLNEWKKFVFRRSRARKIVSRMQRNKFAAERERRVRRGWNLLLRWCVASKTKEMNGFRQRTIIQHQRRILRRFVKHMKLRDLSWGFKTWNVSAKHRARCLVIIKRVRLRVQRHLASRSFHSWVFLLRYKKRKKHIVHIVRQRMQHQTASKAFSAWEHFSSNRRSRKLQILKTMKRVKQQIQSSALHIWKDLVKREKNVESKAAAFVRRARNTILAQSFGSWLAGVKRRHRIKAIYAILRDKEDYQHRQFSVDMSAGFLAWKNMYEHQLKEYGWGAKDVVDCISDLGAMAILSNDNTTISLPDEQKKEEG